MSLDFANRGFLSSQRPRPWLLEAYKGTQIVSWQGKIERQLQDFINENVEARNHRYADKLRAFLEVWRKNQLSGSINVETIDALMAASEMLAVDEWRYGDYFSHLRDALRQLKASVEELPMTDETPPDMRAPSSSPPSSFGPSETPPSRLGSQDLAAAALNGGAPENDDNKPEEIPGT